MESLFDDQPDNPTFVDLCATAGIRERSNWADRFGAFIRSESESLRLPEIATLSLFTGAGGLDIGFHDAGFHVVQMVELDARFGQTLFANRKNRYYDTHTEITVGSVVDLGKKALPLVTQDVDLIIGGPPCQPFSAAGRRANGTPGTDREDGQLFEEYIRLLGMCRPRAFVFENVYGITGSQGGKAWETITRSFEEAGYQIAFRVLDSADYGVAQHRERMFIVGTNGEDSCFKFPRPTHGPDSNGEHPLFSSGQALNGVAVDKADPSLEIGGIYGDLMPEIPPGLNYSFFTEKMGHPKALFAWRSKFSDFLYKADPMRPIRTLKAQSGKYTGPFHWNSRRFTVEELKRLQSFPDAYELAGSKTIAAKQIGNSVPPQIARVLAIAIREQVFGIKSGLEFDWLRKNESLSFRTRKRELSKEYFRVGRVAIDQLQKTQSTIVLNAMPVYARIENNFEIVFGESGRAATTRSLQDGALVLESGRSLKTEPSVEISLVPTPGLAWDFGVNEIRIALSDRYRQSFLAGWKLLELTLNENKVKDSLVQLFGYYAYPSQVATRFIFNKSLNPFWRSLRNITEGIGTRVLMHQTELAEALDCQVVELQNMLTKLKWYGYEIRNANTNPTIPDEHYLIPYSFPTLTAVSVQRTKVLFDEAVE